MSYGVLNGDRYGITHARFWDGTTGRALQRKGKDATLLALYLQSCRHANMIGLYELPLEHLERELLVLEGRTSILYAFHDLHVLHYATYDLGTEYVWVREMARIRAGLPLMEQISRGDRKHRALLKLYQSAPPNPFLGPFFERYHQQLRLPEGRLGPPLVAVATELQELRTTFGHNNEHDTLARPSGKAPGTTHDGQGSGTTSGKAHDLGHDARPVDEVLKTEALQTVSAGLRSPPHAGCTPSKPSGQDQDQDQRYVRTRTSSPTNRTASGTRNRSAAAAPRCPQSDEDPDQNVEVITTLILKEIFPVVGTSAVYADLSEATKERRPSGRTATKRTCCTMPRMPTLTRGR